MSNYKTNSFWKKKQVYNNESQNIKNENIIDDKRNPINLKYPKKKRLNKVKETER